SLKLSPPHLGSHSLLSITSVCRSHGFLSRHLSWSPLPVSTAPPPRAHHPIHSSSKTQRKSPHSSAQNLPAGFCLTRQKAMFFLKTGGCFTALSSHIKMK
ncbi:unnamed protein product, partial [Rangifer tarandus platyrhynchus]